jgi:plasmid maintenance system killer protein
MGYKYMMGKVFMDVVFNDEGLERIDRETDFHGEFASTVADEFRHRLQILRSADSEVCLLPLKALDMQRLSDGDTNYQMRVTDNFRLELAFRDNEGRQDRCAIVSRMTPSQIDN